MYNDKKAYSTIKSIIDKGYIEHSEIIPRINHVGLPSQYADQIAKIIKKYKLKASNDLTEKIINLLYVIMDKILTYISTLCGAAIFAEFVAIKQFSSTLLNTELKGFGSHILYWLGLIEVKISSREMLNAMASLVSATPKIIKAMILGGIFGYLFWKLTTRLIIHAIHEYQIKKDIHRLLKKYKNYITRIK